MEETRSCLQGAPTLMGKAQLLTSGRLKDEWRKQSPCSPVNPKLTGQTEPCPKGACSLTGETFLSLVFQCLGGKGLRRKT